MEFSEFVTEAVKTASIDKTKKAEALQIGLYGIAGEAGSVVSEAKKCFRERGSSRGIEENIREELGDLLWYIAFVSDLLQLDLDEIVKANLEKTRDLWSEDLPELPSYDDHPYDEHKFPRTMTIRFAEDNSGDIPKVQMIPEGELANRFEAESNRKRASSQMGDDLDDNATLDDGYRYHDIIHVAHATVLGWSPVLRALMGGQRRHVSDRDRVQDGARAKAIEEGLAAFVFNYLEPFDFSAEHLDWNLIKHVRRTVRGLEVADQPVAAWRHAYRQAFKIFLELHENRGGTVECDLDNRKLALLK